MRDDHYKLQFRRGHNKDTGEGYYEITMTDSKGEVAMHAAAHYNAVKPIYLIDIVNINIEELGADFPPDPSKTRPMSEFFEEREEKGH